MNFLRRHWKILAALWLVSLLTWAVPRCLTSWQLEHRQAALLQAIEQRTPNAYAGLISETYADDWTFTSTQIRKSMDDVSAQFLTLKLTPQNPQWSLDGANAEFTTGLTLTGKPVTPVGQLILTEAARSRNTYSFHWRKEGWGAWTWKLIAVKNPNLQIPEGYEPGSLSEQK